MIPLLEPIFQGPLAVQGEKLACTPSAPLDAIPVAQLLNGAPELDRLVRRFARHLGCMDDDLRAAASAWSMAYLDALLPPVCAAATLLHHVFPIEAIHTSVVVDDQGMPKSFHIRNPGMLLRDADAFRRYQPLVWEHLAPLFDSLHALTRIPRKILWGNCARHLASIFEVAQSMAPGALSVTCDRNALLYAPSWPEQDAGGVSITNPLFWPERIVLLCEAGRQIPHRLHRQCCLYYKLPGLGYCESCPLDPLYRGLPRQREASVIQPALSNLPEPD